MIFEVFIHLVEIVKIKTGSDDVNSKLLSKLVNPNFTNKGIKSLPQILIF